MKPTELVYSSHDRCEHIHTDWIVRRALESKDNKTVLYLPMSSGSQGDQEFSWGTFSWYFDRFRQQGLEARNFFYKKGISKTDAKKFFDWLENSEVVILGGGETQTGMERYRDMGAKCSGNPDQFAKALQARHAKGKLTVGFSAGAVQLCQHSFDESGAVFGMVRDVVATLHYEPAGIGKVEYLAHRHPDCLVFGLPNDAGIAVTQGTTKRGNAWQYIEFITDSSWDKPQDQWHIKTRQGIRIEHRYADGRSWTFNGGDVLLRVFYKGGGDQTFIKWPDARVFCDRNTQNATAYTSVDEILSER